MVFVTFRSAVGELMKRLKDVRGIRAQRFIGQSAGKGEFDAKGISHHGLTNSNYPLHLCAAMPL